jgi:hypothetical protein
MARDDFDVSPFVAAMRQRGRPHKVVALPGSTAKVAVWVPTASERAEADAAARMHLTRTLKLDALQLSLAQESELFERERDIELLARVLRDPRDPSQAFVDAADTIRDPDMGFTDNDRKLLIAAMDDFARERYEPNLPDNEERLVELILGLKADGALSVHVESFASDTLRSIVLSLAKAWPTPISPSSSAT